MCKVADIIPPRRGEFLTPDGMATNRFNEYLERMASQSNETASMAIENSGNSAIRAKLLSLQQQVGSGNPLTWDETGFTWDADKHSFDQDEA